MGEDNSRTKIAILVTAISHVGVLLENTANALLKEAEYVRAVVASLNSKEK
jgi:hypothetical protein